MAQQRDPALRDGAQHRFTTSFDLDTGCDAGDLCCHDENYPDFAECGAYPGHELYFARAAEYTADAFAERIATTSRALWERFPTDSEMRPGCSGGPCDGSTLPAPMHGAFMDDTVSHASVSDTDKAKSEIEGRKLEDYLHGWIEEDTATFCFDVSGDQTDASGTGAPWGVCPDGVLPSLPDLAVSRRPCLYLLFSCQPKGR